MKRTLLVVVARIFCLVVTLCMTVALSSAGPTSAADKSTDLRAQALRALRKGCIFFHSISTHGGYLWKYSVDLKKREGEEKATASQIWVQPPGTPSVGQAFLQAYRATGDRAYLKMAIDAAHALAWGQLASGGWDYLIDFDPKNSQRWYRRADLGKLNAEEIRRRRNTSTFDDNTTQSALRFLMAMDKTVDNNEIHAAVEYGLRFMMKSQYPNGAWPQRYPPPTRGYGGYYTFNDNAINDCIAVMLDAYTVYGRREYLDCALHGGAFILRSQLPAPQAGWAQQYDMNMNPAWARKFEPPAICSAVTSRNIRTLVDLYLATGDKKFLSPIPSAIAWLKKSQIAPNTWARFYELKTNRPLYFTRKYKLVYTDDDLPTHYSFKGSYGIRSNIAWYNEVVRLGRAKYLEKQALLQKPEAKRARALSLRRRVERILASQDKKGRWVSKGWIQSSTFVRNVRTLCEYLEGTREQQK